VFSGGEISYLFYGAANALTYFNELIDEACEGHNCCGYGQGVHSSSALVRDELGKEDLDSAPVKHSFTLKIVGTERLCRLTALLTLHSYKITKGTIPGPSSVLLKASAFSRNLIIFNSFKCDMCHARRRPFFERRPEVSEL
jgi:hypothetical protein